MGIRKRSLNIPNRKCQECGGWELRDGTEDADWNSCQCEDECPICLKDECEMDCLAFEDGYD